MLLNFSRARIKDSHVLQIEIKRDNFMGKLHEYYLVQKLHFRSMNLYLEYKEKEEGRQIRRLGIANYI